MSTLHVRSLDHIVLRVADVDAALAFYCDVLGLAAERVDEFRAGAVPFPSARVDATTIIDFFATPRPGAQGANVDHIAFAVSESPDAIERFLTERNVPVARRAPKNFGARGVGHSFYVHDPDGNMVEIRTYAP